MILRRSDVHWRRPYTQRSRRHSRALSRSTTVETQVSRIDRPLTRDELARSRRRQPEIPRIGRSRRRGTAVRSSVRTDGRPTTRAPTSMALHLSSRHDGRGDRCQRFAAAGGRLPRLPWQPSLRHDGCGDRRGGRRQRFAAARRRPSITAAWRFFLLPDHHAPHHSRALRCHFFLCTD